MFAFLRTKSAASATPQSKLAVELLEGRALPSLTLLSQQLFGGGGNEAGTGIAIVDTGTSLNAYVSGRSDANDGEGILVKYDVSSDLSGVTQDWASAFPGAPGYDSFEGVAATPTAVYTAGSSYSQTTDTVGDKESKGIVVNFQPAAGSVTWERQTPGAPGAFSYGGGEGLTAITTAVEGGQTFAYVTGGAQSGFSNGARLFVSKLDAAGNVLWTQTDGVATPNSSGLAVASAGGFVYVAGQTNDFGPSATYLKKYDSTGALIWSHTSTPGVYNGLLVDAGTGSLYAVGRTNGASGDFLVEKWDVSGNLIWSQTFDRGGAEALKGVTLLNGELFAAGSTTGGTAGGSDGVVLQLDPDTGALIDTTLWGGAADDSFQGIVATPTGLHLAGTTGSFGSGGSDLVYAIFAAPVVTASTTTAVSSDHPTGSTYGQSLTFTATVTSSTTPTGSVQFQIDGSDYGAPVALVNGTAGISTATLGAGEHTVTAFYTSDSTAFSNSDNSASPLSQSIAKADQIINWNAPAPITSGTALGADQLNATVSVVGPASAGALTYDPPAGTVLTPGTYTLTVTAAATDNYNAATASVSITVLPATSYNFGGFLSPLGNKQDSFKAGRTIPIKFLLTDLSGNPVTALSAVSSLQIRYTDGNGQPALLNPTSTDGQGLRNDGGHYQFNWQTKGLKAGMYTIVVTLSDGTVGTFTLDLV